MNNQLSAPLGAANENIQNQIATQSGTPLPSGEESRRAATEGVSALGRARLDPIWQQREAALNSNLANQGLAPGSEISNVATRQFQQGRNDADVALEEMAQRTGREAQAQTFGQGVAARQLPFSQLGGLKGLMQAPGFNPAGTAAPADLTGAARDLFSGQMQGYGQNQGKKGSSIGGLGQLGMGAGMLAAFL